MILYVGDLHGSTYAARKIDEWAVANGVTSIVQVGDFGLLWRGLDDYEESFYSYFYCREPSLPTWYVCDGNHENHTAWRTLAERQGNPDLVELLPNCYWVQRGKIISLEGKKHLFFGGAESIDRHNRTEGTSWWPEETPTNSEFNSFFEAIEDEKPDVIVTHDAPKDIDIWRVDGRNSATPRTLGQIWNSLTHRPTYWMFGHHHILERWRLNDTDFFCCGIEGEGWIIDYSNGTVNVLGES